MGNNYQRKERKSNHKFEVVRGQELLVQVPLPMAEVWAEMQTQVEELAGQAGLQILQAILENEVTRRVGPPHRPNPSAGCVRWGKQPGYVVLGGQKVPVERPRVRTREGQEVELESYSQLQQDGKLQRAVRQYESQLSVHWFPGCKCKDFTVVSGKRHFYTLLHTKHFRLNACSMTACTTASSILLCGTKNRRPEKIEAATRTKSWMQTKPLLSSGT